MSYPRAVLAAGRQVTAISSSAIRPRFQWTCRGPFQTRHVSGWNQRDSDKTDQKEALRVVAEHLKKHGELEKAEGPRLAQALKELGYQEHAQAGATVERLPETTAPLQSSPPSRIQTGRRSFIQVGDHPVEAAWLRNSCTCPQCQGEFSGQRFFQTADIPHEMQTAADQAGDQVQVTWHEDLAGFDSPHVTSMRPEDCDWQATRFREETMTNRVPWNRQILEADMEWIEYGSFLEDEASFQNAMTALARYGVLFLKQIPKSERAVEDIADKLGGLRHTFYGSTWDVKSVPQAKNIAYTDKYLGPHMDLLYMVDPPQVQILHSLQADAPGGSSILSDGLFAASELSQKHPEYFDILTKWRVRYWYSKSEMGHYRNSHPTFKFLPQANHLEATDPVSRVEGIYYSPPFQSPQQPQVQVDPDTQQAMRFGDYLEAIRAFTSITDDKSRSIFERRLEPGEAVIFDNRRILHARTAFDANQGIRWLKGAYVDSDGFRARLRSLGLLGSLCQKAPARVP